MISAGAVARRAARRVIVAIAMGVASLRPSCGQEAHGAVTELARLPRAQPDILVPTDPGLLFYIHLSVTPKTVVYAARFSEPGRLDRKQPIDVFWRRFNGEGGRSALSFVERKLAYGVQTQRSPDENAVFAQIAGYPQRTLRIGLDQNGRAEAVIRMGNRQARLVYVSVQIDSSALVPRVTAVDVYGIDKSDGRALREHIEPSGGRAIR